jgi:hypothetical protein
MARSLRRFKSVTRELCSRKSLLEPGELLEPAAHDRPCSARPSLCENSCVTVEKAPGLSDETDGARLSSLRKHVESLFPEKELES